MFRGPKALPDLQQAILIATAVIGPAPAKSIREYAIKISGKPILLSTTYRSLARIEKKGWIETIAARKMRDGREIRAYNSLFAVTTIGHRRLRVSFRQIERLWSGFDPIPMEARKKRL